MPTLLARARAELAASFDFGRPARISRAPGRLDVMGGIADYTGSLVCEMPLDRAAVVVTQARTDRELQIFSFNLLDEHQPFTFQISLDNLVGSSIESLRRDFDHPGRKWAGYIAGCFAILHEHLSIGDRLTGLNLALLSTVPLGAGVSSSAAIEVATMMNLVDELKARDRVDPMALAAMCQQVENRVVGAPCGIMDQATSVAGEEGMLLRMVCQPHELHPPLRVPEGIRFIGINSNVKHSVGGGMYGITRCAAFMGHRIILQKMRDMGSAAGRALERDPMHGYLANLTIDDYKKFFRPYLPEKLIGGEFIERYKSTIDSATQVQPDMEYHVLGATDHHVLEAHRVRSFAQYLEEAALQPSGTREQGMLLDKAGHMMYASHLSYTNDARLGADECDLLVELVREREKAGLYGAKITGGGSGGTVAVMCDESARADEAIAQILHEYAIRTGRKPEAFTGSSPGAWAAGTVVV